MLGIADDLLILLCLVLTVVFTTIVDPKKTHPKDFWSSTVLPSHSRLPKGHFPPECCRVHLPFSLGSPCPTRSPDVLNGENGGNISGGARGHDCQEPQAGPKTGPLRPRPLPGIETKSLTDREDRAPKKGADGLKRRAESGLGTQILIELCRIHIHSLQVCVSMIFFFSSDRCISKFSGSSMARLLSAVLLLTSGRAELPSLCESEVASLVQKPRSGTDVQDAVQCVGVGLDLRFLGPQIPSFTLTRCKFSFSEKGPSRVGGACLIRLVGR